MFQDRARSDAHCDKHFISENVLLAPAGRTRHAPQA